MTKQELEKCYNEMVKMTPNRWTIEETEQITDLIKNRIDSAVYMYEKKWFPNKPCHCIASKIARIKRTL